MSQLNMLLITLNSCYKGEIDKQIQVHRKWWNDF